MADLYFFRDSKGNEIDLLIQHGRTRIPIEIKSASTLKQSHLKGIKHFNSTTQGNPKSYLVYNGEDYKLSDIDAVHFTKCADI